MWKLVAIIVAFLTVSSFQGEVPNVGNCGGAGTFVSLEVDGCSTNPCFFRPGQGLNMSISYVTKDASVTLFSKAWYYDFENNGVDFWDAYQPGLHLANETLTFGNMSVIPPDLKAARGFIQFQI